MFRVVHTVSVCFIFSRLIIVHSFFIALFSNDWNYFQIPSVTANGYGFGFGAAWFQTNWLRLYAIRGGVLRCPAGTSSPNINQAAVFRTDLLPSSVIAWQGASGVTLTGGGG